MESYRIDIKISSMVTKERVHLFIHFLAKIKQKTFISNS